MANEDNGLGPAQLEGLLLVPREELEVELKGWLDLSNSEDRATLAKALIAMTNHGGGHVVLGFDPVDGGHRPSAEHPGDDLSDFDQDAVMAVVDKFAEPVFHCQTVHVPHPETKILYPVIRVPASPRPVRTRSACRCGHVKANVYYIRRPGPKSEEPQTGAEWDALLDRCARAKRDGLARLLRDVLSGTSPITRAVAASAPEAPLSTFVANSRERFAKLVSTKLASDPSRYQHGVWTVAYELARPQRKVSIGELDRIIEKVELHHTGWPEWLVIRRDPLQPYPYEGVIECFMVEDAAHSDFWRVSPEGVAYMLRGYWEDSPDTAARAKVEPGTLLDISHPAWIVGEAVLHASRLAAELQADGPVKMRFEFEGLEGRQLTSFNPMRAMRSGWICHQPRVLLTGEVDPVTAPDALPEIVSSLTKPLYEAFSFFAPSEVLVQQELDKMRKHVYAY